MKQKLQIIALIFLAIIAGYVGIGAIKLTIQIIMSKITLLAAIVIFFWQYKKTHEKIIKLILVGLMVGGIFAFDIITNTMFLVLVISFLALFQRIDLKKVGFVQVLMILFVVGYLAVFGVIATMSKLVAVLSLIALFLVVIWREIKIYFTPSSPYSNANSSEIDFVDQNIEHQYTRTQKFFSQFVNVELMTKDIVLNLTFVFYMLLVMIDMLSNIIQSFLI